MPDRTMAQVVADNVLTLRSSRRLSQEDVARRMRLLDHSWTRATVGDIEGNRRATFRFDELLGLAAIFEVPPTILLDPTLGEHKEPVTLAGASWDPQLIGNWVHGERIARVREGDGKALLQFGFVGGYVPEPEPEPEPAPEEGEQS